MQKKHIKKKLVILCFAMVMAIMAGGCGKDKEKEKQTTEEPTTERQRDTTEEKTEKTTEAATEEPTTEEPEKNQSLDVIKLKAYSENHDGEDTISGHIKDIARVSGCSIFLSDDGHLYSYYTDSGAGYKIYDWGKPGWNMEKIEHVSSHSSDYDGGSGEFFVIEGNQYYYVELEKGNIVYNVEGVLLEGQEITDIYLSGLGFEVYCADGSWYEVSPNKAHNAEPPYSDYIDSAEFWKYYAAEEPEVTLPEELSLIDRLDGFYLLSDGKLYWCKQMDAPIQEIADYTFTNIYSSGPFYSECMGRTDTNELLIIEMSDKNEVDKLETIALPDSETLNIWYNSGYKDILVVKTADGYYSCLPEESLVLEPDEALNALTEDVIDICHGYILLSDGYTYELPGWVF